MLLLLRTSNRPLWAVRRTRLLGSTSFHLVRLAPLRWHTDPFASFFWLIFSPSHNGFAMEKADGRY